MDFISHGLYGSVLFGRQNKRMFWWAFFFGSMPDVLVFGPFFVQRLIIAISDHMPFFPTGTPEAMSIPNYVYQGYSITHSIVVFAVVFGLVWLIERRPPLIVLGWPLHILMDLFTHTTQFFPTPILWPISNAHFTHGIPWFEPIIFIPNVILLIILYVYFFLIRPRQNKKLLAEENK